jgi:hypothetical protein
MSGQRGGVRPMWDGRSIRLAGGTSRLDARVASGHLYIVEPPDQ